MEERAARLRYEETTDTFYIEIFSKKYGWSLYMSQKCLRADGAPEDEDPALVHFSMLKNLANLAERGYSIYFTDKNLVPMPGAEKLADYGMAPPDDQIIVPVYQFSDQVAKRIIDDLLKKEYRPNEPQEMTIEEQIEDLVFNGMSREEAERFIGEDAQEAVR